MSSSFSASASSFEHTMSSSTEEKSFIAEEFTRFNEIDGLVNMNIFNLILNYFETSKSKKVVPHENPWSIDDPAMRQMHVNSVRKGNRIRLFNGPGIVCMKPSAEGEGIGSDGKLYEMTSKISSLDGVPKGIVTMASHMPLAIFPPKRSRIYQADYCVSMASHMVPAAFTRAHYCYECGPPLPNAAFMSSFFNEESSSDALNSLASHMVDNDMTLPAIQRSLTQVFHELCANESLTDDEFKNRMQNTAETIIRDIIERATLHVVEFVNSKHPDYAEAMKIEYLSRESTSSDLERIHVFAREIVDSVLDRALQTMNENDFNNERSVLKRAH